MVKQVVAQAGRPLGPYKVLQARCSHDSSLPEVAAGCLPAGLLHICTCSRLGHESIAMLSVSAAMLSACQAY